MLSFSQTMGILKKTVTRNIFSASPTNLKFKSEEDFERVSNFRNFENPVTGKILIVSPITDIKKSISVRICWASPKSWAYLKSSQQEGVYFLHNIGHFEIPVSREMMIFFSNYRHFENPVTRKIWSVSPTAEILKIQVWGRFWACV